MGLINFLKKKAKKIRFITLLLQYLKKKLPDTHSSDKYLLSYLSFWTSLVLRIRKPFIIGITGTAGKTTLTQMLGHVLMQTAARPYVGEVGKTSGNLNGDYGVRLSILRKSSHLSNRLSRLSLPIYAVHKAFFSKYPRMLVLEYGTYDKGHIKDLVKFAPPKIAIITNIGPAHLERHKTVEGVYFEKRALVQEAPSDGLVVLGSEHEFVSRLKADAKAPVVVVDGRGFILAQKITQVVCRHLGLPEKVIDEGLKSFDPPKSRLNKFKSAGVTVIDDSYNANPLSMKLGLDTLSEQRDGDGRRLAVLGVMAELGEQAAQYHKEIGSYARERAELIIGVGEEALYYAPDQWFSTSAECAKELEALLHAGDVVLIKGSHSSKMDVIVKRFRDDMKATIKRTWVFTDTEKRLISSLVAKGKKEREKNEKFAIIDFDSFYKLFSDDEIAIIKKYLAINPRDIGYKLPFLGLMDIPSDIIPIANQTFVKAKEQKRIPMQYLPREIYEEYEKLNNAMKNDIGKSVLVWYGYRSPARQVFIFFDMLERIYGFDFSKTIRRVCFIEYSEHVFPKRQAMDFITENGICDDFDITKEYRWLQANAEKFGFYLSYPKDNNLDMMFEPWHWHYELK